MGVGSVLRTSARWSIAAGAVAMYYQAGLWKNADETIQNYENVKRELDGFVNSVPVIRDLIKDVTNYGSNLVSPATKAVSDFQHDYLKLDTTWTQNPDGIIKPSWNKVVAISCDFMAHSPQILKEVTVSGYNKASDYMNSGPVLRTTATTTVLSSPNTPNIEKSESKNSSVKQ